MTPGSIIRRYLLLGMLGAIAVTAAIPILRIGLIEASIRRGQARLANGLPGPALCRLLQVEPWLSHYPSLTPRAHAEMIRCYVRLNDTQAAFARAQPDAGAPGTNATQSWRDLILRYPNEAANILLAKVQNAPNTNALDCFDVLREELEQSGDTDALAALAAFLKSDMQASVPPPAFGTASSTIQATIPEPPTYTAPHPPQTPTVSTSEARPQPELPPDDPDAQWGVVIQPAAKTYTKTGAFVKRIDGGTLADILEVKPSKIGDLAICRIRSGSDRGKTLVIKREHLKIRPGTLDRVPEKKRQLCVTHARLTSALKERQKQLEDLQESRNPHARDYERVRKAYIEFGKDAKRVKAAYEKATGASRTRYANELRKLKMKQVEIDREYRAIKGKYDAWKTANAPAVNLKTDATAQRIEQQRNTVETELARLD